CLTQTSGCSAVTGTPRVTRVRDATYWRSGWTAGGGLEWAATNTFSFTVEYDHLDFGTHTFCNTNSFSTSTSDPVGTSHCSPSRSRIDMVTVGVNVHLGNLFGGSAPVKAAY